jgi:hypothetical protein
MRLTVVISPALALSVGGDADRSLKSLIDTTCGGRRGARPGADINGDLRSTVVARSGSEDRCLW